MGHNKHVNTSGSTGAYQHVARAIQSTNVGNVALPHSRVVVLAVGHRGGFAFRCDTCFLALVLGSFPDNYTELMDFGSRHRHTVQIAIVGRLR